MIRHGSGTDLAPIDLTLLARRRPWASTTHLALTYLRAPSSGSTPVPPEPATLGRALVLSVSKRLAPAAPLRNMIRRVLRESWRHQAWPKRGASIAVMIRLRALPIEPVGTVGPAASAKLPKGRGMLRIRRPDRALKAVIRAEADSLLQDLGRAITPAHMSDASR